MHPHGTYARGAKLKRLDPHLGGIGRLAMRTSLFVQLFVHLVYVRQHFLGLGQGVAWRVQKGGYVRAWRVQKGGCRGAGDSVKPRRAKTHVCVGGAVRRQGSQLIHAIRGGVPLTTR